MKRLNVEEIAERTYAREGRAMWIVNSPERRYVVLHPEREAR